MKLKENDNIPNSEIFVLENGEPTKKNIEELLKGKKVIICGNGGLTEFLYPDNGGNGGNGGSVILVVVIMVIAEQ